MRSIFSFLAGEDNKLSVTTKVSTSDNPAGGLYFDTDYYMGNCLIGARLCNFNKGETQLFQAINPDTNGVLWTFKADSDFNLRWDNIVFGVTIPLETWASLIIKIDSDNEEVSVIVYNHDTKTYHSDTQSFSPYSPGAITRVILFNDYMANKAGNLAIQDFMLGFDTDNNSIDTCYLQGGIVWYDVFYWPLRYDDSIGLTAIQDSSKVFSAGHGLVEPEWTLIPYRKQESSKRWF